MGPLARALADAGHEVAFATANCAHPRIAEGAYRQFHLHRFEQQEEVPLLDGIALFEQIQKLDLEGIVAKLKSGTYAPRRRRG